MVNAKRRTVRRRRISGTRRRAARARRSISRRRSFARRRFFRTRRRRRSSVQRAYLSRVMKTFREHVDAAISAADYQRLGTIYTERFSQGGGNITDAAKRKIVLFSVSPKYTPAANREPFQYMMKICKQMWDTYGAECWTKVFRVEGTAISTNERLFKCTKFCERFIQRNPRCTSWKWKHWLAFQAGLYSFACYRLAAADRTHEYQYGTTVAAQGGQVAYFPVDMFTSKQNTFLRTLILRVCSINNINPPSFGDA